jgi:hypothetical protein
MITEATGHRQLETLQNTYQHASQVDRAAMSDTLNDAPKPAAKRAPKIDPDKENVLEVAEVAGAPAGELRPHHGGNGNFFTANEWNILHSPQAYDFAHSLRLKGDPRFCYAEDMPRQCPQALQQALEQQRLKEIEIYDAQRRRVEEERSRRADEEHVARQLANTRQQMALQQPFTPVGTADRRAALRDLTPPPGYLRRLRPELPTQLP